MKILAVESSCDETSLALLERDKNKIEILDCLISSQTDLHKIFGGVVPELSARAHLDAFFPMLDTILMDNNLKIQEIDRIALTAGPGLKGSLLIALSFANTIAACLKKPVFPVHHLRAHILACFLDKGVVDYNFFPFLALVVSGGHSEIVKVTAPDHFEVLGKTLDDAAGECFDKAGRQMDIAYPAGPIIDKLAKKGNAIYPLPRAIPQKNRLEMSFSGLKTAFADLNQKVASEAKKEDLCASLQAAIVEQLTRKFNRAKQITGIKRGVVCGGVAANSGLREALQKDNILVPPKYCTDNAAMIAVAASFLKENDGVNDIKPIVRWPLDKSYGDMQ